MHNHKKGVNSDLWRSKATWWAELHLLNIPTVSRQQLKNSVQVRATELLWLLGRTNQTPTKQARWRGDLTSHFHTPSTAHPEPTRPALHSYWSSAALQEGDMMLSKATYCFWDCTSHVKTRAGPHSCGPAVLDQTCCAPASASIGSQHCSLLPALSASCLLNAPVPPAVTPSSAAGDIQDFVLLSLINQSALSTLKLWMGAFIVPKSLWAQFPKLLGALNSRSLGALILGTLKPGTKRSSSKRHWEP